MAQEKPDFNTWGVGQLSHPWRPMRSEHAAGAYTAGLRPAVEELVSNSFDAGAQNVHVILAPDLKADDASVAGGGLRRRGSTRVREYAPKDTGVS